MKRALLALAVLCAACGAGKDRYLPEFGRGQVVASTDGPVTFALTPAGRVVYAELRTNEVFRAPDAELLFTLPHKPDSLAVDRRGEIYAATRTLKHRVRIFRGEHAVWQGPVSRFPVHLAIAAGGDVIVGLGNEVVQLEPRRVISSGWTDPVVAIGRGNRIWVADNGLPGSRERVARGREADVGKRNRFASVLPEYTNPSGMVLVDDELLLCSRTHRKVYRLHIGVDDVARRRDWMKGLVCDRDIAVDARGALYTATNGAIYRYVQK